jgi:hypothetical protein
LGSFVNKSMADAGTAAPAGDDFRSQGFYVRWVLTYTAWREKSSVAIETCFCCWQVIYGVLALAQPNRMRRREVQAPYLSPGFGDWGFESLARCYAEVGVGDVFFG